MTELIKFCQLFCIFSYGYSNVNLNNTAVESVARQEVWVRDGKTGLRLTELVQQGAGSTDKLTHRKERSFIRKNVKKTVVL